MPPRTVARTQDHTLILSTSFIESPLLVGELGSSSGPVMFSGIGLGVSKQNELAIKVPSRPRNAPGRPALAFVL